MVLEILIQIALLVGVFVAMGYATTPAQHHGRRWIRAGVFVFAAGLTALCIVIGFIAVVTMVVIGTILTLVLRLTPNIFLSGLVLALGAGVLLYFAAAPLMRRWQINLEILTTMEYFIQWTLIYVTIYQVMFQQISDAGSQIGGQLQGELSSALRGLLNPTILIVLLLPVLIALWVTITMVKLRIRAENRSEADSATLLRRPEVEELMEQQEKRKQKRKARDHEAHKKQHKHHEPQKHHGGQKHHGDKKHPGHSKHEKHNVPADTEQPENGPDSQQQAT